MHIPDILKRSGKRRGLIEDLQETIKREHIEKHGLESWKKEEERIKEIFTVKDSDARKDGGGA